MIVSEDVSLSQRLGQLMQTVDVNADLCSEISTWFSQALQGNHDLILLVVQGPQLTGWDCLTQLKQWKNTPVIVLCPPLIGCSSCAMGLRCGADDAVTLPYNPEELAARVDALLRRTSRRRRFDWQADRLQLGATVLHRQDCRIEHEGSSTCLTAIQFKLLWLLALHRNQIVAKAQLHHLVLEKPYSLHDRSVDMHLSRVRKKLLSAGIQNLQIQTLRGQGYCLTAETGGDDRLCAGNER